MSKGRFYCQHPNHEGSRLLDRHQVRVVTVDITDYGTTRRYARLDPTRFDLPRWVCHECMIRMKEDVRETPGQVRLM